MPKIHFHNIIPDKIPTILSTAQWPAPKNNSDRVDRWAWNRRAASASLPAWSSVWRGYGWV